MAIPWAELFQAGNTIAAGHQRGRRQRLVEDRDYQMRLQNRQDALAEAAARRAQEQQQWSAEFDRDREQDKLDRQRQRVQDEFDRQQVQSVVEYNKARAQELNRRPTVRGAGGVARATAPAAASGGRFGHIQERHELGERLLGRIIGRAEAIERVDPKAGQVPLGGDLGAAILEGVGGRAGRHLADRVRGGLSTPRQQEYRGLREQFKHSLAVFFPRVSIALMENLSDSYWPVPGESPEAQASKRQARIDVWRAVQNVRNGTGTLEELEALVAQHSGDPTAFLNEARRAQARPGETAGDAAERFFASQQQGGGGAGAVDGRSAADSYLMRARGGR